MFTKYGLPILALIAFIFAVRTVVVSSMPIVPAQPASPPSVSPYQKFVAGAGIVEASSENIALSSNVSGIATEVYVTAGQEVKAGDKLFQIDVQQEITNLNVLLAAAQVAKVNAEDTATQYALVQNLSKIKALSIDEVNRKKYASEAAQARLAQALAEVDASKVLIERHTVKAPVDGSILQVKIRVGEYAQAAVAQTPLMIMGNTQILHVRVDVDENDAWRIKPGAEAEAFLRGNPSLKAALKFVRFEPFVVPKKSLTGESFERVDTRVLQVIYSFERSQLDSFVGQLMDVYIAC